MNPGISVFQSGSGKWPSDEWDWNSSKQRSGGLEVGKKTEIRKAPKMQAFSSESENNEPTAFSLLLQPF